MGLSCSNSKSSNNISSPLSTNNLKITYISSKENPDLLFDYEENTQCFEDVIDCSIIIQASENGCLSIKSSKEDQSSSDNKSIKTLLKFEKKINEYVISGMQVQNNEYSQENSIWKVLRKQANEFPKTELHIDDIIRIGKFPFHIRDINLKKNKFCIKKNKLATKNEKSNDCCRICLTNDNLPNNPLISPCNCKGTMKYIHFNCLQHWLQERIEVTKDEGILIYIWKEIKCELCKEKIKLNHLIENRSKHLIDDPKNKELFSQPSITFESVFPDENKKNYLFLIFMNPDKDVRVGRFLDCDLRINDITVSRIHSKLTFNNNKVYIEDLASKFGTLILLQDPLSLRQSEKESIVLQYRSNLLKISNF